MVIGAPRTSLAEQRVATLYRIVRPALARIRDGSRAATVEELPQERWIAGALATLARRTVADQRPEPWTAVAIVEGPPPAQEVDQGAVTASAIAACPGPAQEVTARLVVAVVLAVGRPVPAAHAAPPASEVAAADEVVVDEVGVDEVGAAVGVASNR